MNGALSLPVHRPMLDVFSSAFYAFANKTAAP